MGTELPATINRQREEIAQLPRTKAKGRELEGGKVGRDRIGSDDENEMIREEKDERLKQLQSQSLQRGDLRFRWTSTETGHGVFGFTNHDCMDLEFFYSFALGGSLDFAGHFLVLRYYTALYHCCISLCIGSTKSNH